MIWIFALLVFSGCTNPDHDETDFPVEADVDTDVDADTDADTDTGEEVVGGNCGGPEPPEDSLWDCSDGAGYGPAWPVAGGPTNPDDCLTLDGWLYTMSSDGTFVTLIRESDGRVITCELDENVR